MSSELITIQNEVSPVVAQVKNLEITCSDDISSATVLLSNLNKYGDELEKQKKLLTDPINQALKEIRGRYKPVEDILEEATTMLRKKMGVYQQEQLEIQKKAEDKIAKQILEGKIDMDKGVKKLEKIDAPEQKVKTEAGNISFKTVTKFEVIDLKKLPLEYHMANDISIREALKNDIRLAGVKYWEEQSIINRRN